MLTAENLDLCEAAAAGPFAERYGVGAVVLSSAGTTAPLIERLADDPQWAVALIDVKFVVFLRRDGPTAEPARRQALTRGHSTYAPTSIAPGAPTPTALALHAAGLLLMRLVGQSRHRVWRRRSPIGRSIARRSTISDKRSACAGPHTCFRPSPTRRPGERLRPTGGLAGEADWLEANAS